jgi:Fe-Mn family superoxide dismutase
MTKTFEEKKFNIPTLTGISEKAIEEHLKLYSGYVKNTNTILAKIDQYAADSESHAYALGELQRRFGFEFDGMRNHEYYFTHLANDPTPPAAISPLKKAVEEEWGDFDLWLNRFKSIALTRGIGWAILYYDAQTKRLLNSWIDEHHLGQLVGLPPILVLDMWEHAYFIDYTPGEKKKYIEAFFENINWQSVEQNFVDATRK